MSEPGPKRQRRIHLRVSAEQDRVLDRSRQIVLNTEQFERFVAALDGPMAEMPTVRRYARKLALTPRS